MSINILQERHDDRRPLVRSALLWGPPAVLLTAVWLFFSVGSLLGGNIGAIFPVVLLGLFSIGLWYQALAALRDLRSEPVMVSGSVQRVWRKGVLFGFFPSHYLQLRRKIFAVDPAAWSQLDVNAVIEVAYWPHTHIVTRLRLFEGRDAEELLLESPPSPAASPAT